MEEKEEQEQLKQTKKILKLLDSGYKDSLPSAKCSLCGKIKPIHCKINEYQYCLECTVLRYNEIMIKILSLMMDKGITSIYHSVLADTLMTGDTLSTIYHEDLEFIK